MKVKARIKHGREGVNKQVNQNLTVYIHNKVSLNLMTVHIVV